MSAILIRCRKTSRVVSTGLTTESVKFVSLAGIQFSMVCQVCGGFRRGMELRRTVPLGDVLKLRRVALAQSGSRSAGLVHKDPPP